MIKLMKSTFYHEPETKRALIDFLARAEKLSMGEECLSFEKSFANFQGRKHAIFVSSGSSANLVLMQALVNLGRLKPGDRVGFSALTWATNVMPIMQLGLIPVPVDCELTTLNVSPKTLEAAGPMQALFLTNVLGFADDLESIKQYCQSSNITLLEDNCESLGSKIDGTLLGNFGLASTFSFFVGHHMSTIEGGMVCTDDDAVADMVTMVRAHGWDRNLSPEKKRQLRTQHHIADFQANYTFYDLAYNARPTDINGFIGNQQLPYLEEIIARRAENFARFQQAAHRNPDIFPLELGHMELISNFAMPVVYRSQAAFEKARTQFTEAEAEIRPIIAGDITEQPFYKKYLPGQAKLANAALIHQQGLYFANNPELDEAELDTLIKALSS